MNDERDESKGTENDDTGERDLRYGEVFGTQRDRSSQQDDAYLDPESGRAEDRSPGRPEGRRNLRYGEAFGTQRDRSMEEDGYLDPEFGSRGFTPPGGDEAASDEEEPEE